MQTEEELLTDAELCERLKITPVTLRMYLRQGPPKKRHGKLAGDIRTIKHITVGGSRRWHKSAVNSFINGE